MSEKFCSVNQHKIRYLDVGESDKTMVLVHGLGASLERWYPIIPHLSRHFRLVIPDLIGFGFSDKPHVEYTVDFFVGFLSGFLDAVGIKTTTLMGSSLGGQIVAEFSMKSNQMVDKIILVSPSGVMEYATPALDAYIQAALYPNKVNSKNAFQLMSNKKIDHKVIKQFVERMNLPNAKMAFLSALLSNRDKKINCDDLIKVKNPTLVIWGLLDPVIPPKNSKTFFSCLPNCKYVEMLESGHTPFVEEPEKFSNIVLQFMRDGQYNDV